MADIYASMAGIMTDIDAIGKNQKNQQQGFKFRGIDDVYNAVHPILAKHGVFTVPTLLSERTEERTTNRGGNLIYRILTMRYTFFASDGSHVDSVVIGEGMDSGDKAGNKAMAVAHKYALLQALCIPTEDMVDPDSETQDPSRKADLKPSTTPKQAVQETTGKKGFDPATATTKEVVGMVKANMAANLITKPLFTVKRAWNQILELCSGDVEFAKGMFAQYGADSSDKITYAIYQSVFNAMKEPGEGPEHFIDDDIPFCSSDELAIA